jgi:ribonuclease J
MKKNYSSGSVLKVLSLGGWSDVTQNIYVYETPKDIVVIDCGIGFPDDVGSEDEVVVPDISYLLERKGKIRGIVISHGHLDHYGALPFLLSKLGNPPIYASRLVRGFINSQMADFNLQSPKVNLIDPSKGAIRLGSFEIFSFRVNHSVPDSLGFCINTPAGKIFHVSDYKFDLTPVDGRVFQINKAARLAHPQVLALFSDCLGAVHPGFTSSEKEIKNIFNQIIRDTKGQLFITTLSSNISRFQQAIEASFNHGRKIVLVGRSVEEKIRVAQRLGYLNVGKKDLVPLKKAKKYSQNQLTYLIAGSYGQSNSALSRLAGDEYRDIKLEKDAVVVFSADPAPPGTKETVDTLVDKLTLKGAKVYYYEIQENLHVSGHGSANDIRLLFSLVNPKYFIPIGGNPRHVRAYSFLAEEMGAKSGQVLELFTGEVLEFSPNFARVAGKIEIKEHIVKSRQ